MADVTARATRRSHPAGGVMSAPIADGVTVYEGMLVALEAGYANHWADGANDVFAGVLLGGDDRANDGILLGETADSPVPEARIDISGVTLMHLDILGTPTQAVVGDLVYCGTSNPADMTTNSSGRTHPIGWLSRFRSATDVDVTLFTPSEMLAQATA